MTKVVLGVAGAPEKATLCSERDLRIAGMLAVFAPLWLYLKSFSAPSIEMLLVKEKDSVEEAA